MKTSDEEWQRLMPVTQAEDEAELDAYMRHYREGIVEHWGEQQRADAAKLYAVWPSSAARSWWSSATELAPGTFWPNVSF